MATKRLHYYDQQFLVDSDFADEQRYHVEMRRRINRLFHTFGITNGLQVIKSGSRQVTVKAGGAIDRDGREIGLETDQVLDLSNAAQFPANETVFVTLAYHEAQTDPSTATGAPGNTRITESAIAAAGTAVPPADGSVIRLARFTITDATDVPGNPNDEIDGGVRHAASSKLAAGSVVEATLAAPLAAKINTPSGIAAIDGVSSPGGNVDLVPAGAITVTADAPKQRVVIGESHSARTDNPHATTAAQIQALALTGGTLTGNLQVSGNLGVNTAPATRLHVTGTAPAVRIADGTQASGRVLVSDALGNATWKDSSRYTVSGALNVAAINATTTPTRMADFVVFTKAAAESAVEVMVNTRALSGGFTGSTGVSFQVRIDNNPPTMGNEAAITDNVSVQFISMFAVFQGLAAGSHTVSVFVRTFSGVSTNVVLDPGGLGGRIVVKETF